MVDRFYLSSQSLREYQDRGMLKWMGFFLSEHTGRLEEESQARDLISDLSDMEKISYLNQSYSSQMPIKLTLGKNKRVLVVTGRVKEIDRKGLLFQEKTGYRRIGFEEIMRVEGVEENEQGEII